MPIEYTYRQVPNNKLKKSILHIVHMVPRINIDDVE